MEAIILAIVLLALAIGGIAIKMFVKPGATFKKSCTSSYDPDSQGSRSCACASGMPDDCDNQKQLDNPRPEQKAASRALFAGK